MGQFDQRQTCPHCGVLMAFALPPGGKGARVLQCLACDRPDPIEEAGEWLKGELGRPFVVHQRGHSARDDD